MTGTHLFLFKLIRIFNVEAHSKIQDKSVGSNRVFMASYELEAIRTFLRESWERRRRVREMQYEV